jgi:pilus assembly protein Flp/PilA
MLTLGMVGPSFSSFRACPAPGYGTPPRIRKEASLFSHLRREEGQGLAEYALILALIALVVVGAITFFGTTVQSMMNGIATTFGTL